MATRKKGAAGATPAAAAPKSDTPASPPADTAEVLGNQVITNGVAEAIDAGAVAGISGAVQQSGIATVLEAPVVPNASTENVVVSALVSDAGQSASEETVPPVTAVRKRVEITLQDFMDDKDRVGSLEVEVRTRTAPSRWRIGKQFSRTATPLDLEMLSDLEIVSLLGDEMLLITAQA